MSTHFQEDEILGKAYDARLMRRLLAYVRPYRATVVAAAVLLLVSSLADLSVPNLLRLAVDRYLAPAQTAAPLGPDQRVAGVVAMALAVLGIRLAGGLAKYGQNYLMTLVGQRVMYDLRMHLFGHLQRLSVRFFTHNPVGRLITRTTNDVDALNDLITQGVVAVMGDVVTLAGIVAIMLWLNWRLALVAFAVLPVLVAFTVFFRMRMRDAFRAIRVRIARINAYLNENFMGMSVIQLFNREPRNFDRFDALNRDHLGAQLTSVRWFALFFPTVGMIAAVASALILWYGGGQVVRGAITLGSLIAFLQYAGRFFDPISDLAEKFNILQSAMASSERIFRIMDEPIEIADPAEPVPLERVRGEIEFRDVHFAYEADEGDVLRGVSFHIRPGESVAFVGHTGAGKTSVINLLLRFYDPQRGEVAIDGVDVRRLRQADLRRHVGLVLQDVFLFSGTIGSNIRLGNAEIPDDEVRRAAEFVNAHRFIERLPGGYVAEVKERGVTLSVGQKQLIAFARALAHNPEILLVLDEATSSVDTETEVLIQDAMRKVLQGRTSIIIAHRLSTIQHVDRIIVLRRGRIVEEGTHRELLLRGGVYSKLYQLQYRDQEARLPAAGAE